MNTQDKSNISNTSKSLVQSLIEYALQALNNINNIDREVRARGLQNEQWFLDWQDALNRISVK